jgi:hypothetical protein
VPEPPVRGSPRAVVAGTVVWGAEGNGILVGDRAEVRVTGGTVRRTACSAVRVAGEAKAEITALQVEDTPQHGIGATEHSRLMLGPRSVT